MMTRIEIEQAVVGNLSLIRGVIIKTLKKYGANLCAADVDDIESNTVLCLLEGRLDNYDHTTDKKLQTWIGYIAMQRCVDYLRAINKKATSLDEEPGDDSLSKTRLKISLLTDGETPADEFLLNAEAHLERRSRLRAAVLSLSEEDQHAYSAMSQDGYSVREYASKQGIKESSVHTRRHRLVKNIRKCI